MTEPQTPPPAPTPATATDAQTQMNVLAADPAWRDRFLAGDAAAKSEFANLTAKIVGSDSTDAALIDAAMAGAVAGSDLPTADGRQMAGIAGWMRGLGISEPVIREHLEGKGVSSVEMKLIEGWKQRHLADEGFVDRFLRGDVEAKRLMSIANAVIARGVKVEAA
jgi:hypothetical protein